MLIKHSFRQGDSSLDLSKQKSIGKYFLLLVIFSLFCTVKPYAQENAAPPLDILLVLDNSASMKKNDPRFLSRLAMTNFLHGLEDTKSDSRIGFIVFSENIELVTDLIPLAEEGKREELTKMLYGVNYSGQYTNISAAIERAIYELKQKGRRESEKVIILMTDGIIDTGDPIKDFEKHWWLRDELAEESKSSGIRIFGIAFTDKADFELIQTLGRRTNGGYFRVLKAEDVEGVLYGLDKTLSKPRLKPESPPRPEVKVELPQPMPIAEIPKVEEKGFLEELSVAQLVVACLAVLVIIVTLVMMLKGAKKETSKDLSIREAKLIDINKQYLTDKPSHNINKEVITIGRVKREDVDICIDKNTISASHAQIKYEPKDNNFYLIDLNSKNGTYMNGRKMRIPGYRPIPLKSGDIISLGHPDMFKFEFILPGKAKRGYTL